MLRAAPTRNPASDFAWGFGLPLRGLRLIRDHAPIRAWSLAIAAVSFFVIGAVAVALALYTGDLLALAWPKPAGALVWLWYAAAMLLFAALFVMGVAIGPTIATAPLVDPLSAATERAIGAAGAPEGGLGRMAAETAHAVGKAALRISILLLGHALLLPLWLIPGPGQVLWTLLSLLWTLGWLVFEHLDVPANRRGYRFRELFAVIRGNLAACYGFATAVHLLLWIPIVNLAFIPLAVVGATLLFAELRAAGRIPPARAEAPLARS